VEPPLATAGGAEAKEAEGQTRTLTTSAKKALTWLPEVARGERKSPEPTLALVDSTFWTSTASTRWP